MATNDPFSSPDNSHFARAAAGRAYRTPYVDANVESPYYAMRNYNVQKWANVDRWRSDQVSNDPNQLFSYGDNARYSTMLSGTLTGPAPTSQNFGSVRLSNNFGRPTATSPAQEIGHLDRAIGTASRLASEAGAAIEGATSFTRNLRRVQAASRSLGQKSAPGAPSTPPTPPTPMMQSTVRRGNRPQLVDFNRPSDLKKVSSWNDDQVNSGTGYGKAIFGQMRTMAQQQMVENNVRRGGQPLARPVSQPLSATLPDIPPVKNTKPTTTSNNTASSLPTIPSTINKNDPGSKSKKKQKPKPQGNQLTNVRGKGPDGKFVSQTFT